MKWKKLGNIFCPDKNHEWMNTHATLPIPVHLHEDIFRIYFSTRDTKNRSHGAFVDVNLSNLEIKKLSEKPVLSPGDLGLFDDCGISLSCFVKETKLFYYMGWHLPKTVPFSNQIGAAHFADDKMQQLKKNSLLPMLGKCAKEAFSFGYPWVSKIKDKYYMWYDANLSWKDNSTENYHFSLRMAESDDGLYWKKKYIDCLEMAEGERAIARPCVLFEQGLLKMWYSVNKNGKYHLGYSESTDGIQWKRKDNEVGLQTSSQGWDSEEVEYPYVFDHKGQRYMLYNGNSYGKTGFGLAQLESERA